MNRALQRTLKGTPASTYAGLGSAFITLADEKLKPGGRLAFVLPATALTGSRWAPIRKLLLDKYDIEWVVVSHDERNRTARRGLPGRRYVGFSESTRIAETLIVATKAANPGDHSKRSGVTRFVNLRRNPDEPIEAIAIARAILSMKTRPGSRPNKEIAIGSTIWGEIQYVPQAKLNEEAYTPRSCNHNWPRPPSPCRMEEFLTSRTKNYGSRSLALGRGTTSDPTKCRSRIQSKDSSQSRKRMIRVGQGTRRSGITEAQR